MSLGGINVALVAAAGALGPAAENLLTHVGTSPPAAKVGGFDGSNYLTGSAGFDLAAGTSVVVEWWCNDDTVSNERLIGYSSAASGWSLRAWTSTGGVGGPYGTMRLTLWGGTGEILLGVQRYKKGLNCCAFTRTVGGALRVSINGNTATQASASTSYVNGSGAGHYIGRDHGTNYAANQQIIAVAFISAELSDADLKTASSVVLATESYSLPAVVAEHVSLVSMAHAVDWDGTSAWLSAAGSAPITYTKTGSPTLTPIPAEDIYTFPTTAIGDSAPAEDEVGWYSHDAFASVSLQTDAESVRMGARMTDATWAHWYDVGADVDGAWSASRYLARNDVGDELLDFSFAPGQKTVRLYTGLQRSSAQFGTYFTGKLRVPAGSSVAVYAPDVPTNACVIVGDSISVGQDSYPLSQHAWAMQLRRSLGGSWSVINQGYGSRRLVDDGTGPSAMEAFAADIATRLLGSSRNVLVWEGGTVDWSAGDDVDTWETDLGLLLDELKTLVPSLEVFLVHPLQRTGEGTPSGSGDVLEDFRTAMNDLQSSRAAWCTVLDAPASVTYPGNFDADLVHLANAGADQYEMLVYTALTS